LGVENEGKNRCAQSPSEKYPPQSNGTKKEVQFQSYQVAKKGISVSQKKKEEMRAEKIVTRGLGSRRGGQVFFLTTRGES